MFRSTRKKWWPGCDVFYAYKAGRIPHDKFDRMTLIQGIRCIQKHYPATIDLFSMDKSEFSFDRNGVIEIVNAIPAHIRQLSLNVFGLHSFTDTQTQQFFAPLAPRITSCYLHYHDYVDVAEDHQFTHLRGTAPGAEIARVFTTLRQLNAVVDHVSIGSELTLPEWRQVLSALPPSVRSIEISPITALGALVIPQALLVLPPTVSTVAITRRNLNEIGSAGLIKLIQQLPPTVSTLDLSLGQLYLLGKEGMTSLIQATPPHLTIKLDHNFLERIGMSVAPPEHTSPSLSRRTA